LTTNQQTNATTLGFTTNLPNATGAYFSQTVAALGAVTSTNTRVIARNQLPDVALSGTTSLAGAHTHTIPTVDNGGIIDTSIAQGASNSINSNLAPTNSAGNHTHTLTTESINGGVTQQSFDITPKTITANAFIYLGNI
jgi:hypothetical protein